MKWRDGQGAGDRKTGASGIVVGERVSKEAGLTRDFTVVIERDEEGWLVASVPSLPGCHTQALTMDELLERAREAIAVYAEGPRGEEFGEPLELVGIQRVAV